ncbi:hypothetical protein A1O3_05772 [Capronia epimyces CBS 606.96]|uniref:Uncharacterized protein n=1 Tax=Capronia epimyces CBS 606.96 TaxID=1182542 RepID=W9XX01_9EURO|nr:uncharacterized protein A1O3_05772 [Capronia epimyces CBS 606.96]EXJ85097.1 hypothetical protein A1O3_05772 [Capronia epimyces CBS 606.96]
MRGLNIEDPKDEPQTSANVHFSTPDIGPNAGKALSRIPDSNATLGVTVSTSERPLSSSQLPKPRDSMLESLARHVDTPSVRQTKTSAMRLRRSIGKTAWGSSEKKQEKESRLHSIREKAQSSSMARVRQVSPGGPFRSNSRGRYAVTTRGSPYAIPSRFNTKLSKTLPDTEHNTDTARNSVVKSPTNLRQSQGRDAATRQSSIPLPSRSNHPGQGLNDDGANHEGRRLKLHKDMNAGWQDYEAAAPAGSTAMASMPGTPQPNHSDARDGPTADNAELLSMKEVLSTPAPCDDDSVIEHEASGATVHGSDSLGGFRVKRVRNTSKGGPTLRITDSATRILLGDEHEPDTTGDGETTLPLRHKASAPDLRRPSAVKEPSSRRTSALLARPLSFARSIADRSQTYVKGSDDEEIQKLINADGLDGSGLPAELPGSDVAVEQHSAFKSQTSLNTVEAAPTDVPEKSGTSSLTHGDWPCKEFADFNICADSSVEASEEKVTPDPTLAEMGKPSSSQASVRSRPSTIVLRQAPTKEISPFLFQDLEQEKASQERYLKSMVDKTKDPESSVVSSSGFPPRISSRKPKPPPIIVSSPEKGPSVNPSRYQAATAYGVAADTIRRPKDVKTFSQSLSPKTDSSKARKASHKLTYSPSTSSKKVISNIRGLFHKRSIESTTNENTTISETKVSGKARLLQGSMRRKPVPDHKLTNPLSSDAQGTTDPDTSSARDNSTRGERSVLRNPFISPTTPFTATVRPSPNPQSPSLAKFASPAVASRSPTTPGTSPSLSTTTGLTHSLLDLARAETNAQRKASLIELSKCMVEVVNSARDAEKAMEKAKMEAARAEVSWLKVQKEVGSVECSVRGLLELDDQPKG